MILLLLITAANSSGSEVPYWAVPYRAVPYKLPVTKGPKFGRIIIPCWYIISPTFKDPANKAPSPSSVIVPDVEEPEYSILKVFGFIYSPNKLEGIEITPISLFEPVGKNLLASKVLGK